MIVTYALKTLILGIILIALYVVSKRINKEMSMIEDDLKHDLENIEHIFNQIKAFNATNKKPYTLTFKVTKKKVVKKYI